MLWRINEIVVFLLWCSGGLASIEMGFRLGCRFSDRGDDTLRTHASALQGALLGLLALLLGFTFTMAVSRFDQRKSLIVDEANAIGTANLRSEFLEPPQSSQAKRLLRDYADSRIDFYNAGLDDRRERQATINGARIQKQLWEIATAAAKEKHDSISIGLLLDSLNQMFDLQETNHAALDNHVPEPVLFLLLAVTCISLALVGFGCGLTKRRRVILNGLFAALITLVVTLILDIDRPRRGMVRVPQESLTRLRASMEQESR